MTNRLILLFAAISCLRISSPQIHADPVSDPDPTRYAKAIQAFTEEARQTPIRAGAIVVTGSSSMRMWHDRIKADLDGLTIIPRGFGGSQYSDLIHYADEVILAPQPRAVLVYEGDNDVAHGKTPERILADLVRLVSHCRQTLPELRFYIIGIKPSIARWSFWPAMEEANTLMQDFANLANGVVYIDVAKALLDESGQPRAEFLMEDNLHLTQPGYDAWASAIAPVLMTGESAFEETAN